MFEHAQVEVVAAACVFLAAALFFYRETVGVMIAWPGGEMGPWTWCD